VGLKDCVYKETVEVSLKKGGNGFNCFRFFKGTAFVFRGSQGAGVELS
jgi:hypothetical protein